MRRFIPGIICVALVVAGVAGVIAAEKLSVKTAPPVVVKTFPKAGDDKVNPNIKQIRVTYSKEMRDKSWSAAQMGDGSFPEVTGDLYYEKDKRTFVMPVKLKPNSTYVVLLNTKRFTNFKDVKGRSAMPYFLVFETKAE
jgi:Big-like domain-containing protein